MSGQVLERIDHAIETLMKAQTERDELGWERMLVPWIARHHVSVRMQAHRNLPTNSCKPNAPMALIRDPQNTLSATGWDRGRAFVETEHAERRGPLRGPGVAIVRKVGRVRPARSPQSE